MIFNQVSEMIEQYLKELRETVKNASKTCFFVNNFNLIIEETKQLQVESPTWIDTASKTLEGARLFYVYIGEPKWKLETLFDLLDMANERCTIFVNSANAANTLKTQLSEKNYSVGVYVHISPF